MFRFTKTYAMAAVLAISLVHVSPLVCLAQTSDKGEIPITSSSEEGLQEFLEGRDAFDMGRTDDARALFDKAIQKDPKFASAYLYKAYAANSAPEWRSNMDLAMANKSAASEGEAILIDMNWTFLNNDAEKRFALAQKLGAMYPTSQRALLVLAGEHQGRKDYAKARALMQEAIQLNPEFPLPHRDLAFSYIFDEPKDFSLAEQQMKKFVELRPKEASAYIGLGDVYRAQFNLEKARDAYGKATEVNPKSDVAYSKKGHANTFLGNYEEARGDFKQAEKIAKDNSKETWANFGAFTYLYAGDVKSALDANQRIIENIENMGIPKEQLTIPKMNSYFYRARMAMHHGKFDISEKALKEYAVLQRQFAEEAKSADFLRTQNANIALWEGMLAACKGDFKMAGMKADENTKLLEADKNPRKMEGFHRLMGRISLGQKNYQAALDHYKQADVNNVEVKYESGLAQEGLGNASEAQKLFKEVAEWNFNSIGYALVRGDAMRKTKSVAGK